MEEGVEQVSSGHVVSPSVGGSISQRFTLEGTLPVKNLRSFLLPWRAHDFRLTQGILTYYSFSAS